MDCGRVRSILSDYCCTHILSQNALHMRIELMNGQSLNLKNFFIFLYLPVKSSLWVIVTVISHNYLIWHIKFIEKTIPLHV
jgi:hypothetical protein